jgi:hypothetical protein
MMPKCKSLLILPARNLEWTYAVLYTTGFIKKMRENIPMGDAHSVMEYPVFVFSDKEIPSDLEAEYVSDENLFRLDWQNHKERGVFYVGRDHFSIHSTKGQSVKCEFSMLYNF